MRKRFKVSRICSSENYALSKRVHQKDRWDILYEELREVNASLASHQVKYYIKVFGKIQYIPEELVAEYEMHDCVVYREI